MNTQTLPWDPFGRADSLEIAFDAKALRTVCEREARAKRDLGARVAEMLKHRLADLRAATSVSDLIAGNPRELNGAGRRQMIVELCEGYRIVFCANHSKVSMIESGDLDWSRVNRIKILRIERSHG